MNTLLRLPFTLTMLSVLIAAGIYGRSHVGLLDQTIQDRAGYSMRLIVEGQVHRAITSLLFTAGGWRFYSSIAMFGLGVGYVEWNYGTTRSLATFFGIHITTLALMTIGVLAVNAMASTHRGQLLWHVQDVGPSAGYYGCIGLALAGLASPIRWPIIALILLVLIARATWSFIHLPEDGQMLSADFAHLIAFPLGMLCTSLVAD
ncbi:hypothetical protein FF011L_53240 [Roseimaritima multifibrata]|uniref:Rhomboid family protein n=1 Tax=Roseimaritima multifibrata TaxID=1930274 RepID=A0A517MNQ7_9BACT|nr:hypothetical protein [Roseimaritima multifibrata]QDS96512.1 hypothetical protein FF011L_53240 [Roseimaritima multifibrata]